jgi:hypothetical protein
MNSIKVRPVTAVLNGLIELALALRRSLLLSLVALGIVFHVVGIVIGDGVVAGLLGIWGTTVIIYAGAAWAGLKLIGYN